MPGELRKNDWLRRRVLGLLRVVSRLWATPDRTLVTLAIVVGLTTGLGAVGFSRLIKLVEQLYFEWIGEGLQAQGLFLWLLPLLPMSGGLLVGLITVYFAPEAEGHGVPEVMDAMARKGGRIRPRVAGAKAVASALTIGSGGAAGTEGPIIQIGSAIGSGFGQWLRVSLNDIRVLIGCGAAAGIASIFNAPIAGVLFAAEIILREISLRGFIPIILSSVLSSTITQAIRGHNDPIFPVPAELTGVRAVPIYAFTVQELGNYCVLGIICGLVGVSFIKLLYLSEDLFRKLPGHRVLRPVVGALLLGIVTVGVMATTSSSVPHYRSQRQADGTYAVQTYKPRGTPPAIMGNGYPVIGQTLEPGAYTVQNGWTLRLLLVLLVAKLIVTCLTLGSGGSGGVFAPSLFLGATAGGAFGLLLERTNWFAHITPGAYALVGMAAVVAATTHAPLTAALILFELTRDYSVILPIMLAAALALTVAQAVEPASIYTLKLLRRGVRFGTADLRLLQRIPVREVPHVRAPVVRPHDPVDELVRLMRTTRVNDFVVVDERGRLTGMVLGDDLRTILLETEAMPLLLVSDVMRDDLPTVSPDETLDIVLNKFAGQPMQSLPVIDPSRPDNVNELVTRAAVMNIYHHSLAAATSGR